MRSARKPGETARRLRDRRASTWNFQRVTCMQSEKKYCIRLRFIEPHGRVTCSVCTRGSRTNTHAFRERSTKASVSQVHSTIARRHTPLIFIAVFLRVKDSSANDAEKLRSIYRLSRVPWTTDREDDSINVKTNRANNRAILFSYRDNPLRKSRLFALS